MIMNVSNKVKLAILVLGLHPFLVFCANGSEDLNENPNQLAQKMLDPNLLVPTVMQ